LLRPVACPRATRSLLSGDMVFAMRLEALARMGGARYAGLMVSLLCVGVLMAPSGARAAGRVIPEPQASVGFLTYPGFPSAMATLSHRHPNRVRLIRIGHSSGGYPVYDVLVSDFADRTPLRRRIGLAFN